MKLIYGLFTLPFFIIIKIRFIFNKFIPFININKTGIFNELKIKRNDSSKREFLLFEIYLIRIFNFMFYSFDYVDSFIDEYNLKLKQNIIIFKQGMWANSKFIVKCNKCNKLSVHAKWRPKFKLCPECKSEIEYEIIYPHKENVYDLDKLELSFAIRNNIKIIKRLDGTALLEFCDNVKNMGIDHYYKNNIFKKWQNKFLHDVYIKYDNFNDHPVNKKISRYVKIMF